MFAHPTFSPVKASELQFFRVIFLLAWVVLFGIIPFAVIQHPATGTQIIKYSLNLVLWVLVGWFVGYKRLIMPLGMVFLNENKSST
jgi:hypothetical protein